MKHPTMTRMSHMLIQELVNKNSICVDMTVGNGYDTELFCACGKFVYGFDIQSQAIENTLSKLTKFSNFELILDNHSNIDNYINEQVDFVIYNLGYLPSGDKSVVTKTESTITSLQKVFNILKPTGYICIVFYPGHDEGKKEMDKVLRYFEKENVIMSCYKTHIEASPQLYLVSKK